MVYTVCPVCKDPTIHFVFSAKDHTVSHETFEIWQCDNCMLRFTQNIPSKQEISAYYQSENYISHSDSSKGLINYLYHNIRKTTLISKRKLIEKITKSGHGNILDIGAGTGAFLDNMQKAGWQVTGLEPDETAKEKALQLYGLNLKPPGNLFQLAAESFNAITMWHVLEHVHDLHEYMDQLKKLLKPNGFIFLAVPNYTCYDQKVYKEYWAAYDVPRHLYHFSPDAMIQLIMQHGLKLKSIRPMWYDSFYVSMLSEKYRSGKNNIIKAFFTGLVSDYKALLDREKTSSIIYVITQ